LYRVKDMDLISVFCMQILSFPNKVCEEAVLSPSYVFVTFVKNQIGITAWIHIGS
jgi:hypothetical protein